MPSLVNVHDKTFKPYLTAGQIDVEVSRIADLINKKYMSKRPLVLAVLNGAFVFAADLCRKFTFDCEISFIKLSSYSGTETTGHIKQIIGLDKEVRNRDILVLEDIIDTGITIDGLLNRLNELGAADVTIACLLFKPAAFQKDFTVHYAGFEIPNDFIIGYGLDYDGLGRNLPDIYQIT